MRANEYDYIGRLPDGTYGVTDTERYWIARGLECEGMEDEEERYDEAAWAYARAAGCQGIWWDEY